MALSMSLDANRQREPNRRSVLIDHMTSVLSSGARKLWYNPDITQQGNATMMTDQENAEVVDYHLFVGEYREALNKPWFMAQRIMERDCPIHTRWCSVQEAGDAKKFVERTIMEVMKKRMGSGKRKREEADPFVVVPTMGAFQLLNNLHSFKEDNLQCSGMSEIFLKMWAEQFSLSFLIENFDNLDEAADLLDDMNDIEK